MIVLYIIVSIYISAIWLDYYRFIGNYKRNSLLPILSAYIIGCLSVIIVVELNKTFLSQPLFYTNNHFINSFLYFTINVGLVEEFAKASPFILIYLVFKKEFKNPIDYLAYFSFIALGFSTIENIGYFSTGSYIILMRAILCTLGHIIDTSFIAYGILLCKFRPTKSKFLTLLVFSILGILSHGVYDFCASFFSINSYGWIPSILFFFITIPIFRTIINNALNNSTSILKFENINHDKIFTRLVSLYGSVFGMEFIIIVIKNGFDSAIYFSIFSMLTTGIIVFTALFYVSKIKITVDKWEKIKVLFPFTL